MGMDNVLIVEGLGKRFRRYHAYKPRTFMQTALSGLEKMKPIDEFWALKNVSFSVSAGEALGVLGRNGSGKSTLLRLIGGVGRAEEGQIWVNGTIGALLDMGAGFHNDLTGRENLVITGLIAGLSKRQVLERFDEIVDFAELNKFIDSPIRTYSSGMRMRLAFSIAIHNDPALLLVDEHLSVGDIGFATKCIERIEAMRANGCAIVLISQSPKQIEEICDRALLLNQGQVVAYDLPAAVTEQYEIQMGQREQSTSLEDGSHDSVQTSPLKISQVTLSPERRLTSGEPLLVEVDYICDRQITYPIFSLSIVEYGGRLIFQTHSQFTSCPKFLDSGHGKFSLFLERLDLPKGDYFVNVDIHATNWTKKYDYHHQSGIAVRSSIRSKGNISPPFQWKL